MTLLLITLIVVIGIAGWFYHHQMLLKERAHLMREAIRNQEFTFRLPVKGLFFGERALQEAFNETGREIGMLLARNEVESWQKLTRVLTHEIMNATTPITSICQAYLEHPNIAGTVYEEGIRTIHDTCWGLSLFVDSYRKLSELQESVLVEIPLQAFLERIRVFYPGLEWQIAIHSSVTLSADENMLRQVLINLIKNACEAGATRIDVRWKEELWVSNNGARIPVEVAREMFIPFFTTKRSGSGIGLSLSRQLMMRQGGDLRLAERAVPGYSVTFILTFSNPFF
ncbi:HAMP domain-containing sensor histidine kinase [uncultured Parabacteroides sp.]|uniref:sensor histidine kinase n=1 Tax=uncultured Parabacteroides sp. TaxID=512312 RepID=UPI0028049FAB|nr:HAMP domain-containing sensor histidine kinase [uncultured Parabacteroides sp.]MBD9167743.1 sensor histidine kinase [Parabacteroides johnsonii]